MHPSELKQVLSQGMLSFPVTHFDRNLDFDENNYQAHIEWLSNFDAAALFAAGGTGEMFSLKPDEVVAVASAAKGAAGKTPIISGTGFGTRLAIEIAQAAQAANVDGLLLLPHYLIGATQEGIYQHVKAICDSVDIGVILYNRANSVAQADTLYRLGESCPNLIGFKDGTGDINTVKEIVTKNQERFAYIGGLPTHETYAQSYDALGFTTYSSAVYNFIPQTATVFYNALRTGDNQTMNKLLSEFFFPLLEIRNRAPGYAVSIIKAGLKVIGRDPGPVRPPLTDLSVDELNSLKHVIGNLT